MTKRKEKGVYESKAQAVTKLNFLCKQRRRNKPVRVYFDEDKQGWCLTHLSKVDFVSLEQLVDDAIRYSFSAANKDDEDFRKFLINKIEQYNKNKI